MLCFVCWCSVGSTYASFDLSFELAVVILGRRGPRWLGSRLTGGLSYIVFQGCQRTLISFCPTLYILFLYFSVKWGYRLPDSLKYSLEVPESQFLWIELLEVAVPFFVILRGQGCSRFPYHGICYMILLWSSCSGCSLLALFFSEISKFRISRYLPDLFATVTVHVLSCIVSFTVSSRLRIAFSIPSLLVITGRSSRVRSSFLRNLCQFIFNAVLVLFFNSLGTSDQLKHGIVIRTFIIIV